MRQVQPEQLSLMVTNYIDTTYVNVCAARQARETKLNHLGKVQNVVKRTMKEGLILTYVFGYLCS